MNLSINKGPEAFIGNSLSTLSNALRFFIQKNVMKNLAIKADACTKLNDPLKT